jgi:putative DNA primase/helicase
VGRPPKPKKSASAAAADALEAWSVQCEMKSRIDACLGLMRKMLTVPDGVLDANPWLLNCRNGTVDLRTGALRAHRREDYITKLVDLPYVVGAKSALWERTVDEVYGGDAAMVDFAQRWFGYCATGSVREQCFVVHWGSGSNGKSTILETVSRALGEYAGTAAPGLLSGDRGERHPTELADLRGRRMVTAHETQEGEPLREGFVKSVTGGDRIKARYMRGDFFEFTPTHKLQLLTNHQPVVRGQDDGIWRRIRLLPYLGKWGDAAKLREWAAEGVKGARLKDEKLPEKLAAEEELVGVLAWVVEGARRWFESGLTLPAAVVAAGAQYRADSDRLGLFVHECCSLGATLREPLVGGMGAGLYPAYTGWAKEGGMQPIAKRKFLHELRRLVPTFETSEAKVRDGSSRRTVLMVHGISLASDDNSSATGSA